jgi:hypothetical protein
MPVVISEFEVVADAQPAQRRNGGGAEQPAPSAANEPCPTARTLRVLEVQALRVWAH